MAQQTRRVSQPTATVTITAEKTDAVAGGTVDGGEVITYTIVITNSGTQTADNVDFSDTIPAGTTLVGITTPPTTGINNSTATDVIFDDMVILGNGGTETIVFQVQAPASFTAGVTEICNQGTLGGSVSLQTGDPDEVGAGDPDDATCTPVTATPRHRSHQIWPSSSRWPRRCLHLHHSHHQQWRPRCNIRSICRQCAGRTTCTGDSAELYKCSGNRCCRFNIATDD